MLACLKSALPNALNANIGTHFNCLLAWQTCHLGSLSSLKYSTQI